MVRPLVADELVPQGVPEYPILHFKQPMKVQKPNSGPTQIAQRFKSNPEHINQRTNSTSTASSIQAFRQNLVQMEEALDDYEYQKSLIESQQGELHCQAAKLQSQQRELESQQSILESRQAEITELKLATAESNKQVKCLEEEKAALTVKVKKFTEICARYKAHMNDVVVAQTHLMSESSKIKENSAKIREESKAILKVHGDRESHESKLRSLINHAKSIRPPVERMVECTQSLCL
jgi:chromosome segregation ATPase